MYNIRRSYKTFTSEVITLREKWTKVKPSSLDVNLFNSVWFGNPKIYLKSIWFLSVVKWLMVHMLEHQHNFHFKIQGAPLNFEESVRCTQKNLWKAQNDLFFLWGARLSKTLFLPSAAWHVGFYITICDHFSVCQDTKVLIFLARPFGIGSRETPEQIFTTNGWLFAMFISVPLCGINMRNENIIRMYHEWNRARHI